MLWQFILLGVLFYILLHLVLFLVMLFNGFWKNKKLETFTYIKRKMKFGTASKISCLLFLFFSFSFSFCFSVHFTFFFHNLFVLHIQIYINIYKQFYVHKNI